MTIVEELRAHIGYKFDWLPTELLDRAANDLEALQKENADLRKQLAELTVKKTQVYNPPKPSIGNFSS